MFTMNDETRGHEIKRRRLALGIKSVAALAEATGIDRQALAKAERGEGSVATVERIEAWLGRKETEESGETAALVNQLRVTLRDVYMIGELVVEGPVDRPKELADSVAMLLAEIRRQAGAED